MKKWFSSTKQHQAAPSSTKQHQAAPSSTFLFAGLIILAISTIVMGLFIKQNFNRKLKIAMVCISTPNRQPFSQYTIPSLQKYADRWGYELHLRAESLDESRFIEWSKVKLVLDALKEDKHDWVVWFDDDIFITNPKIPLEKFIRKNTKAHFIIAQNEVVLSPTASINSGVFLVKNTPWAKDFLQRVWDIGYMRHKTRPGLEERAMRELLATVEYRNSPNVVQLPGRKIQSFLMLQLKDDKADHAHWQPGDFCAHMLGATENARVLCSSQLTRSLQHYPVIPVEARAKYTLKSPFGSKKVVEQPSIVITTLSTKDCFSFAQHTLSILEKSVRCWGYDLQVYEASLDSSRAIRWSKIKAIQNLLKTSKSDWIVWCNNDVEISPIQPLEQFIYQYGSQANLIISAKKEVPDSAYEVDTGLFFIRNTPWSQQFLQRVWDLGNGSTKSEEEVIALLMATPEFAGSPLINRVPVCNIQSFMPDNQNGYGKWKDGDFALNMDGLSAVEKEQVAQQFST